MFWYRIWYRRDPGRDETPACIVGGPIGRPTYQLDHSDPL